MLSGTRWEWEEAQAGAARSGEVLQAYRLRGLPAHVHERKEGGLSKQAIKYQETRVPAGDR